MPLRKYQTATAGQAKRSERTSPNPLGIILPCLSAKRGEPNTAVEKRPQAITRSTRSTWSTRLTRSGRKRREGEAERILRELGAYVLTRIQRAVKPREAGGSSRPKE